MPSLQDVVESSSPRDLRQAARQAIGEIQSRLSDAGQLSLAQADAGQLSLAAETAGRPTLPGEGEGGPP